MKVVHCKKLNLAEHKNSEKDLCTWSRMLYISQDKRFFVHKSLILYFLFPEKIPSPFFDGVMNSYLR